MSNYTTKNIGATPQGIPISKYYPDLSSTNVIWDDELTLTADVGPFTKGTKISSVPSTEIMTALLQAIQGSSAKVQELEEIIAKQGKTIEELKEIIEQGGGGQGFWPDIGNVDGGSSDDAGEDGGKDDIHIVPNEE